MENKNYNSDIYSVGYTSKDSFLFWQGGSLPSEQTGGGATTLQFKNFAYSYYTSAPEDFVIPNGIVGFHLLNSLVYIFYNKVLDYK